MIQLQNIYKSYKTKSFHHTALNGINLTIPKGSIYGIIGPSGAGKSTLIRCLNGLEKPDSGQVLINGVALNTLEGSALREARRSIGMVFQDFKLLSYKTVEHNIRLPLIVAKLPMHEQKRRVNELLALVGLEGMAHKYPSQLSGGQKQRVAIARALVHNPEVLLCDEATSALDPQTSEQILELLRSINHRLGITILLITHDMSVIKRICERVALLDHGIIVEEADTLTLFSHPRSAMAKSFVLGKSLDDWKQLAKSLDGKVIRITYRQQGASKPLISEASRRFNIDINIIEGAIETLQNELVGHLLVTLMGDEKAIAQTIDFFNREDLLVEVLS